MKQFKVYKTKNIKKHIMNNIGTVQNNSALLLLLIIIMTSGFGCDDGRITDWGFDGQISGQLLDQNGNIVSGDITIAALTVFALGEEDDLPIQIRVQGDGSFANTHLFPQSYSVWVEGPVDAPDPVTVDLTGDPVQHDITVTPFLTIPPPVTVGSPATNEVTVSYQIIENQGNIVNDGRIYVSTVSYPSQSTGSGGHFHTIQETMDENVGEVTVTGLEADTKYYIRVTARAEGTTDWNLSDQTIIETP